MLWIIQVIIFGASDVYKISNWAKNFLESAISFHMWHILVLILM